MTVLQLGPYPPPHGGVQTNLVAIREHLRRHHIAAPVINLTRHRQRDGDDVFYPRTAMQLVWRLLTVRADILHLHIGGQLTRSPARALPSLFGPAGPAGRAHVSLGRLPVMGGRQRPALVVARLRSAAARCGDCGQR